MPQFGAATVITGETRLLLLDCFETLVELDSGAYRARKGVTAFLEHFATKMKLAVVSDAEESAVRTALDQAGLLKRVHRVYHAGNAIERDANGRIRKRLDVPLADYRLEAKHAVFIGDSPLDAEAARRYQVPFIRVPRSEDRAFSFATLIGGPSRYNSSEFSAAFFEQYIAERKPGARPATRTPLPESRTPQPEGFKTPPPDRVRTPFPDSRTPQPGQFQTPPPDRRVPPPDQRRPPGTDEPPRKKTP
jgi:hypothetical protein